MSHRRVVEPDHAAVFHDRQPWGVFGNEKHAHTAAALGRRAFCRDDIAIGDSGIRDPAFFPSQYPAAAVLYGNGVHAQRIGSAALLRYGKGKELLAAARRLDDLFFQRLRAAAGNQLRALIVRAYDQPQ